MILIEYVKEQLHDSFMTRFINNVVTYTATQATQQQCNMYEVFKVGLHMIHNKPIVSNKYYSDVMCL